MPAGSNAFLQVRVFLERGRHDDVIRTFESAKHQRGQTEAAIHCITLAERQDPDALDPDAHEIPLEEGESKSKGTFALTLTVNPKTHPEIISMWREAQAGTKSAMLAESLVDGYRIITGSQVKSVSVRFILRHLWRDRRRQRAAEGQGEDVAMESTAASRSSAEPAARPKPTTARKPMSQAPLDLDDSLDKGGKAAKPTPPTKPVVGNWASELLASADSPDEEA